MNIFFLDQSPYQAAMYYCDIHLNKMIIESCQMLSTAIRIKEGVPKRLYHNDKLKTWYVLPSDTIVNGKVLDHQLMAATHPNHPCTKWVRNNVHNFIWVYDLAYHLNGIRVNRLHCAEHNSWLRVSNAIANHLTSPLVTLDLSQLSYPALAMPIHHIAYKNPIQSYRNYYTAKLKEWLNEPAKVKYTYYTNRPTPDWLEL